MALAVHVLSSAFGGEIDGVFLVGRRHRSCAGGPCSDRIRDSGQGIQFRQYPDFHGHRRCLHRNGHAWPRHGGAELKTIARRIAVGPPVPARAAAKAPGDMSAKQAAENDGLMFGLDQPVWKSRARQNLSRRRPGQPRHPGWRRRPRAIACAMTRRRPSPPPNRVATCCFPSRREGNASAPKSERPIRPRPNSGLADRAAASQTRRNAAGAIARRLAATGTFDGSPIRYRSGAAAAHHRHSPNPAPAHPRVEPHPPAVPDEACRR